MERSRTGFGNSNNPPGGIPPSTSKEDEDFKPVATRWNQVKRWDDVVAPDEKRLVRALKEVRVEGAGCDCLKEDGEFFLYCEARRKQLVDRGSAEDRGFVPSDPTYQSKVSPVELQLWCMSGRQEYSKCSEFPREQ